MPRPRVKAHAEITIGVRFRWVRGRTVPGLQSRSTHWLCWQFQRWQRGRLGTGVKSRTNGSAVRVSKGVGVDWSAATPGDEIDCGASTGGTETAVAAGAAVARAEAQPAVSSAMSIKVGSKFLRRMRGLLSHPHGAAGGRRKGLTCFTGCRVRKIDVHSIIQDDRECQHVPVR